MIEEAKYAYMQAHVRLNAVGSIDRWQAQDVVRAYWALPAPAASFEDWCAGLGIDLKAETQAAANESALAKLQQEAPDIAEIKE